MVDRDVALEALSALCNASVRSVQSSLRGSLSAGDGEQQLDIRGLIPTVLEADATSRVSGYSFCTLKINLEGGKPIASLTREDARSERSFIIDEEEFFAPQFDYDFTSVQDTKPYYRGGELYERPCGWYRFGLKVLDKYDDNTWLGSQSRSTESVPGEWPVSYHGTSMQGAGCIIHGFYKPGRGARYGRGIYSTPYMAEAIQYAKTATSSKTGGDYLVILQNRINPEFRRKHENDKYWLVHTPDGLSKGEEQEMVERAIRPYALLVKEANPVGENSKPFQAKKSRCKLI